MAHRWHVTTFRRFLPLVAALILCGAPPCYSKEIHFASGFEGRVTDRETGQPIEGAIVVVKWGGSARSMATGMFICLHVAHAITDKDGRYRVPAWKSHAPQFSVDGFGWTVDAYKSGYGQSRPPIQPNITMPKWTGTADEWVEFLGNFAGRNDCLQDEGEGRKLGAALHRRILKEVARSEASTAAKAKELQYFHQRILYLEESAQ